MDEAFSQEPRLGRCCAPAVAAITLLMLCSCATRYETPPIAASELPADVAIATHARFGERLAVMLHLENGTEFKCFIDTGSPGSLLPQALEPELGKGVSKGHLRTLDGPVETENIYAAPKVFLGDTRLVTGERIGTWKESYGILGMDCLRHYCIQLDFDSGKMRFLDSRNTDAAELGRAFRLSSSRYTYIHSNGLLEKNDSEWLIDTGCNLDGMVTPKLFRRLLREGKAQRFPIKVLEGFKGRAPELISVPTCIWGGETYTNLVVEAGHPKLIGMKFLARHLVTFDFPNRMMYLKPVR